MVPSWVPGGGVLWVYLTGVALIAAAVSFAFNRLTRVSGILLAVLLFSFIATVHVPGLAAEATMQMSMVSILKDFALAGGALLIAARGR